MSRAVRPCPLQWSAIAALPVDAFAVFVAEDERPLWGLGGLLDWQMRAVLSRHLHAGHLHGRVDEALLMTASAGVAASRLFAFGLGKRARVTEDVFTLRAKEACASLRKAGVKRVAIGLPEAPALPVSARLLVDALQASALDAWLVGPAEALESALNR